MIATLRCGYADGLRRMLGTTAGRGGAGSACVLLRGQRRPIVGFVQMDMTLVETGTLEVQVGDIATIVGEDAKQRITLKEFAEWSGELPHEFLTSLGPRLPRMVK
jgi:alanine racemase